MNINSINNPDCLRYKEYVSLNSQEQKKTNEINTGILQDNEHVSYSLKNGETQILVHTYSFSRAAYLKSFCNIASIVDVKI